MGRRQFDLEFKHTIVELLLSGKTLKEICLDYSLGESMVSRWCREYSTASGSLKSKEAITEEQLELTTLRKELREVKMERDILKKAVSTFSKNDK